MLECVNGHIYTGISNNVAARYEAHRCGKGARYTRMNPPTQLLAQWPYPDRASASKAEYWLKKKSRVQKLAHMASMALIKTQPTTKGLFQAPPQPDKQTHHFAPLCITHNKPVTMKKSPAITAPKSKKTNAESTLEQYRQQINQLDKNILSLINQRATLAQQIGALKHGMVKYRPEREASVLRRIQDENQGPLSNKTIAMLFREVMSACLAMEEPVRVSFLGPHGTHTETAAKRHFGHAAQLIPASSIAESIREAELGRTDFAVVPVENSLEGGVGTTLDLLFSTSLKACGETVIAIHHHLLAAPNIDKHAFNGQEACEVLAHPQALAQCAKWLKSMMPNALLIPTVSNAAAAAQVAQSSKLPLKTLTKKSQPIKKYAIAGDTAAEFYQLQKVVENIEDDNTNNTRFLVLGQLEVPPSQKLATATTGGDKTSLIISVRNKPGELYKILSPLEQEGVSMSRLESRPARIVKQGPWEYVFYVDIEGHQQDVPVARALEKIRAQASFLKIIGSYPRLTIAP